MFCYHPNVLLFQRKRGHAQEHTHSLFEPIGLQYDIFSIPYLLLASMVTGRIQAYLIYKIKSYFLHEIIPINYQLMKM